MLFFLQKDVSYMSLSRALKTFENTKWCGWVLLKKVPGRRSTYRFLPDHNSPMLPPPKESTPVSFTNAEQPRRSSLLANNYYMSIGSFSVILFFSKLYQTCWAWSTRCLTCLSVSITAEHAFLKHSRWKVDVNGSNSSYIPPFFARSVVGSETVVGPKLLSDPDAGSQSVILLSAILALLLLSFSFLFSFDMRVDISLHLLYVTFLVTERALKSSLKF